MSPKVREPSLCDWRKTDSRGGWGCLGSLSPKARPCGNKAYLRYEIDTGERQNQEQSLENCFHVFLTRREPDVPLLFDFLDGQEAPSRMLGPAMREYLCMAAMVVHSGQGWKHRQIFYSDNPKVSAIKPGTNLKRSSSPLDDYLGLYVL